MIQRQHRRAAALLLVLLAADGAIPSMPLPVRRAPARLHATAAPMLAQPRRAQIDGVATYSVLGRFSAEPAPVQRGPPLHASAVQQLPQWPSGPPLVAHGVPLTRALIGSLLECDLSVDGEDLLSGPRLGAGGLIHANLPLLNSAQEVTLSHFAHLFFNISSVRESYRDAGHAPPGFHEVFQALGYRGAIRDEVSAIELQLLEVRSRAAYGKLFRHNLGLIHQELKMHKTCTALERADLWQEGSLGLLRAIQLFDPARKVRFSTYACWHIRAHILHALRDKSRMLRLPQPLQDDMKQVRKATAHLTMENDGRKPTASQIAEVLDWPEARVQRAVQGFSRSNVLALVANRGDDARSNEWQLGVQADTIQSSAHGIQVAEVAILKEQFRNSLKNVQEGRQPEHAKMLALRYGLIDGIEWSTKQIAERFKVTSQVVYKIIRTEVKYLQAHHEDFTSFDQEGSGSVIIATVRTSGVRRVRAVRR
ncbi:hypothetical protein T492DRAFT_1017127 [Pavlovales sp. CCMP2436]|nr:hypothetical protein T492DRAFT_1017127 [Pavlovales sp. CCMP2436]